MPPLVDCCVALDEVTARGAISTIQMSGGIFGATGARQTSFPSSQFWRACDDN